MFNYATKEIMSLPKKALYLTLLWFVSSSLALQCYSGSGNQVTTIDVGSNGLKCVRYQFKCYPGDGACNPQEIENGTMKWAYAAVDDSTCTQMTSMPQLYSNVYCCASELCNKPLDGTSSGALTGPGLVLMVGLLLAY